MQPLQEGRSGCPTDHPKQKEPCRGDRNFKKFRCILKGFQKRIGWAFPFSTLFTRPPHFHKGILRSENHQENDLNFQEFSLASTGIFLIVINSWAPRATVLQGLSRSLSTQPLKDDRSGCRKWAPRAIVLQWLSRQRSTQPLQDGRSGCPTVQQNQKEPYRGERNVKKFQDISTTPRTLFFLFFPSAVEKKNKISGLEFFKKKRFSASREERDVAVVFVGGRF